MKHAEANKYACPMTIGKDREQPCRGGDCAAWRWAEPKWGDREQRRGFCGLAGESRYPLNPEHEHP